MIDHADVTDPAETPPPFGDGQAGDRLLPTPGVYLARGLVYAVVLLGVAAVAWAAITPLDVVVNARGRLMVRDEPIRVTPPEPGLATEVPVRVGDHVREGDLLVRLDSFKYGSELGQAQAEMAGLLAEIDRHSRGAREIREGEEFIRQQMETTDRAVAIETAKLDTWRRAAAEGLAPQIDLQTQERALIDVRSRSAQLRGELAAREAEAAERDRQAVEGRAKADGLAAKLRQLAGFERRMTLVSPVAGVITQLAVLHPGSVVGTGDAAVVLAPDDKPLLAAIQIPNVSMRRLRPGLLVRLRFDAYPYQDFGDLEGVLDRIDPDAGASGEYRAWVSLRQTTLRGVRGAAPVTPGLQLDAEMIVDRRTVLDYLLRPFQRLTEPIRVAE
jgi:HlyD family secretion protein